MKFRNFYNDSGKKSFVHFGEKGGQCRENFGNTKAAPIGAASAQEIKR
jgi:hypothetical protein